MIAKAVKALTIVVLLILALGAAGIVVPRPIAGQPKMAADAAPAPILVLSNPIHTDIAIAVDDEIRARFAFLRAGGLDIDNPGLRYLIFGWGGRAFYVATPTWADLKPMPVLKSFTLDSAVMHVDMAGDIPVDGTRVMAIAVDHAGYEQLLAYITASFAAGNNGPVPLIGSAYGDYDAFFEAKGYFNALAGCNTWTAAGLRQAGVTTGWWTALPWMLRLSLRLHNDAGVFAAPRAAQP